MSQQIQLRNGTAAAWTTANSLLAIGEVGTETDTHKLKIGDGVTLWNSLAYAGGLNTWATLTDKATANLPVDNTALATALAAKAPLASPTFTGAPIVPTATPLTNTTQAASTAYADAAVAVVAPNAPITVTAGFTFAKAAHANRRIGYNSASAGTATFDNTAGFINDDGFRLMQEGAGAVTLAASVVTFSNPKSLPLTTTGAGTFIEAEWDPTIGQLVITSVGALVTLGANTFTGTQVIPTGTYNTPALQFGGVVGVGINYASGFNFTIGGVDLFTLDGGAGFVASKIGTGFRAKEGANGKQGIAVLVAGTVTVANTFITANSRIFLTSNLDGGTVGFVRSPSRVAGTSFTITSSSATDTSTVAYEIFEPA